jgi:uncharacterized membrane-anchored protein
MKVVKKMKGNQAVLGRVRENRDYKYTVRLEKRQAILDALAKATADSSSLAGNNDNSEGETSEYYSLTHEEIVALINGDMEKIESWVSNLGRRQATWLLRCLIKEQG